MFSITPQPPYDFGKTLRAARSLYAMGHAHHGAFRRVIRVGAALALIELRSVGTVEQPRLEGRLLAANAPVDEQLLSAKLHRIANVEADLAPFYRYAQQDPALHAVIEPVYGMNTFQSDTLFEAVALTVIEQQITLKMAQVAEHWLMQAMNESLTYEGVTYYTFPDPLKLAECTVEDLLPMKITGIRIRVILDIARQIASGELDLEALRDQPFDVVYPRLRSLRGIGHWTAAWAIIRALGVFPPVGSADVALRTAVNRYFHGQTGRCEPAVLETTLGAHGEYEGIISYCALTRWEFERHPHIYT